MAVDENWRVYRVIYVSRALVGILLAVVQLRRFKEIIVEDLNGS